MEAFASLYDMGLLGLVHVDPISGEHAQRFLNPGEFSFGSARALKAETGTAPLVLLDEVAAHLDADRRASLFDEICALEAQAWMTGTGPELFIELGPRAQTFSVYDGVDGSGVDEVSLT